MSRSNALRDRAIQYRNIADTLRTAADIDDLITAAAMLEQQADVADAQAITPSPPTAIQRPN
jgi:hypothetical protein